MRLNVEIKKVPFLGQILGRVEDHNLISIVSK